MTKADDSGEFGPAALHESERELIKQMLDFPVVVEEAANSYSPALIANYTYELVKRYNHFYQSITILNEENEALRTMRVTLSKNVGTIINRSMQFLGIDVPERM